ncbi:MAG: trypsin-like peptidase domain-containing protein [Candidatus Eisenbacteria bacterium]|nr:trypsin-like peptidase domain-containing protein [Candidatus Eisenbacteria bacterium]
MRPFPRVHILAALLLAGPLAIPAASTATARAAAAAPGGRGAPQPAEDLAWSRQNAITRAAERAGAAVVSISVVQTQVVQESPFFSFFPDEFFDRFSPPMQYRREVPGLGSGFIVNREGYVLTNSHVVQGARQIKVTLTDGRQFEGKLVGSDPSYDLAVVKVEGKDLPVAAEGNSDDLIVGEWAIAIGNPFGFLLNDTKPSVTVGVVSATRRDIKPEAGVTGVYKNMIQTDAAINPGNSGGPLVNAMGEVIGINTFILSKGGGSIGLGFAIPINTAKKVFEEIVQYGRVRSVWIGVSVQDVTPYLAQRFALTDRSGVIILTVERGSPAARAGVRVGDVVRQVDGEKVRNADEAGRAIFGAGVGDTVRLTLERQGKPVEVRLTLEEARDSQ